MLLATAVIGSGIMAQRLTADGAVALLANTLATAAALGVLIAVLAPISGAHFNPAVSLASFLRGDLSLSATAAYVVAQAIGCCLGAALAHAMFELPLIQIATQARSGFGQLLSEMVAAAGLVTSCALLPVAQGSCVAHTRMDWCRLLVYSFHVVCKPCDHARSLAERYVLGNRTFGRPRLRRRSVRGCYGGGVREPYLEHACHPLIAAVWFGTIAADGQCSFSLPCVVADSFRSRTM